jgi:hypothetical protein
MDPKPSDAAGAVSFLSFTTDKGRAVSHFVVWIDVASALDERDLIDTIAHEASHVSAHLLYDDAGQKQDGDCEALAYLIGWVTGWIWQGCQENRNPAF